MGEEGDETGFGRGDRIQSIERGFAVLLAFDAERRNPSLIEVATATGLSRPAVRRILLTLQHLGYVEPTGGSHWRLTPRVLTIGQHFSTSSAVITVAEPHMIRLVEQTGESASLSALDGNEVVYLSRVPANRVLSVMATAGTRVPAHPTSMGRVLLAAAPPAFVERYLVDPGLTALTPHTITDPDRFREALEKVRRQGWALVAEERERGLIAASAPIRDRKGEVVAALSTSSSTGRMSPEHVAEYVIPVLTKVARDISADL
ncbi:IclR family transcriptional regulator domain-containing protein [Pseudonocardia sp. TRM90224]|uniref:IclR family transcriptional regulator domain-containing protein n=1 Tax=Pseudonocardia sp. TRM90224 TaxID=2812678 RepID=UPI001E4FCF36|nr:IclR family transcriptional regulator C-terminal domain-containing protein [Pseudonocardia sp. TRM90224]